MKELFNKETCKEMRIKIGLQDNLIIWQVGFLVFNSHLDIFKMEEQIINVWVCFNK